MQHSAPSLCVCVCLQDGLCTQVAKVSLQLPVKVSLYLRWCLGVRRVEAALVPGGEAGLVAVRLHVDADLGRGLVRRRAPGALARLWVSRWGGTGDLQVQSDAEEQWWNRPGYRFNLNMHSVTTSTHIIQRSCDESMFSFNSVGSVLNKCFCFLQRNKEKYFYHVSLPINKRDTKLNNQTKYENTLKWF